MRTLALALLLPLAAASGDPVVAITDDTVCQDYQEDYRLVRKDVLAQLSADRDNLKTCEPALQGAQGELKQAEVDLKQAKEDLEKLHAAALEQRAAIAELKAQKKVLEGHITKLEGMTCPDPSLGDQFVQGWESVDGVVGMGTGYVIGMGTCIGVAWVFNQPQFVR